MSTNGMNYPMYNTLPYPQINQQQSFYGPRFSNPVPQLRMPPYGAYPLYAPMPIQPQYNSYDHVVRSAAETLATYNRPPEQPNHFNHQTRHAPPNSIRRSGNHAPGALNSARMYYCEICRIACGGHATYQAHLNGSKHKKKELNAQNSASSNSTTTKSTVPSFRCELCDITCTSSDAYKAHIEGSKHEKATKLHRKLGKAIPSTELPQIHPTSDSQTETNDERISTETVHKPVGEEYIEIAFDESKKPLLFHCKLCDCKFNDANAKDAHLKGKRHRLSYRRKVDPNFEIADNSNKVSTPKPRVIEPAENPTTRPINHPAPVDLDDDTKCLMTLHEQIVPSQNLLSIVEQFISVIEAALKSCSGQLLPSTSDNDPSGTLSHQSPLMGVSRIGSLAKSLMIKSDRSFHIVIICAEWPTVSLLERIASMLPDNVHDTWRNKVDVHCRKDDDMIVVESDTDEGRMSASITFTSMSMRQQENAITITSEHLGKGNCLKALYAMHSVQWFQNHASKRQHASALIRCLRYKTTISSSWQTLPSEAIEILIEHTLSRTGSAVAAFRRTLECLAGGLALSQAPGLQLPWQTDPKRDAFENLTVQARNDITDEAQTGLRLMAFGQLNRWLEEPQLMLSFQKRPSSDHDDQVSAKRQCIALDTVN